MSIREYKRFIESELRSGWKSQRTIEEEWEWVKTVGQPAIPTASGPVSAVTNVLGNTAMLDMRLDHKEQSECLCYIFTCTILSELYFCSDCDTSRDV
jgi:hypothetical protein